MSNKGIKYGISIIIMMFVLACGLVDQLRSRVISQKEAAKIAGIFCLPDDVPVQLSPTPTFYWVGDDGDLPDTSIVYRGPDNSSHLVYILASLRTHSMQDGDVEEFYSPQYCKDKFIASSSMFNDICISTDMPTLFDDDKKILDGNPPFITSFRWLANKDEEWTFYRVLSTLPIEETKQIVNNMCID